MPVPPHGEGEAEQRVLRGFRLALELSVVILLVEAVGAYLSRSLSLTVDAVHNAPDILAFALSWTAIRASSEGATSRFTFGAHRLETFAGLLNAALVCGTGAVFGWAALAGLIRGVPFAGEVQPLWLLAVAVPTLGLRAVNLAVLGRSPRPIRDLNLRSVLVHLASDIAITGVLLLAGLLLLLRPVLWWVDPGAAVVIAGILVYESLPLFRDGWDVLTERIPRDLTVEMITQRALEVPGVTGFHDVHVWSVCSSLVCLTAHVGVSEMTLRDSMEVVANLRSRMEREFGILHATFEVEGPPRPTPRPRTAGSPSG
jgi:cobalt-zinc-cadmium efflux system protein